MTLSQATKWLNRVLHEEGIPLDKGHCDKLAVRIRALVANETADALADIANVIAEQSSSVRNFL